MQRCLTLMLSIVAGCGGGATELESETATVVEVAPESTPERPTSDCANVGPPGCVREVREGEPGVRRAALAVLSQQCARREEESDAAYCDELLTLYQDDDLVLEPPTVELPDAASTSLTVMEGDLPTVVGVGFPAVRGDGGEVALMEVSRESGQYTLVDFHGPTPEEFRSWTNTFTAEDGEEIEAPEVWERILLLPHPQNQLMQHLRDRLSAEFPAKVRRIQARLREGGYRPLLVAPSPVAEEADVRETPFVLVWWIPEGSTTAEWRIRRRGLGPIVRRGSLAAADHTADRTMDGDDYECDWRLTEMRARYDGATGATVLFHRLSAVGGVSVWCDGTSRPATRLIGPD